VILAVEHMRLRVMEAVEEDDLDYDYYAEKLRDNSKVHKDILHMGLQDLIVNYNASKVGVTRLTCILRSFELVDKYKVSSKRVVPTCFAKIIGNPLIELPEDAGGDGKPVQIKSDDSLEVQTLA